MLHVFIDVHTEDSLSVDLGVVFILVTLTLGFVESGESSLGVSDEETSVGGSLQGAENTGTSRRSCESHIEDGAEWLLVTSRSLGFNVIQGSVNLVISLEHGIQLDLGEQSSGEEESGSVGSRVVGETSLESELSELRGGSLAEDSVSLESGPDDLADDSRVGDSGNESVLGGIELVFIVGDEVSSGPVVGLSLSSSSVFDLVSLEVSLVLLNLDESHFY